MQKQEWWSNFSRKDPWILKRNWSLSCAWHCVKWKSMAVTMSYWHFPLFYAPLTRTLWTRSETDQETNDHQVGDNTEHKNNTVPGHFLIINTGDNVDSFYTCFLSCCCWSLFPLYTHPADHFLWNRMFYNNIISSLHTSVTSPGNHWQDYRENIFSGATI